MNPSLMPSTALHLASDMVAILRRLWWTRKRVPRMVTARTSGNDDLLELLCGGPPSSMTF